jgi:hypothetical protein
VRITPIAPLALGLGLSLAAAAEGLPQLAESESRMRRTVILSWAPTFSDFSRMVSHWA